MNQSSSSKGTLSGIRVLDMSRILAGPWIGQLLADLGAEVIKIERPGKGDDTRAWGPPFVKDREGNDADAAYFMCTNRGKKSLTLDIAKAEGQAIIRELAQKSDILLENYKVGDLKRYGLDYEALSALNPRLIYCSVTGFGQTGPYRDRPGYDYLVQGMGGIMSMTGEREDRPGGGPQRVGVAIADLMTGMYSTVGILAALHERTVSGQGQYIDMALLDTTVAWLANQNANYLIGGQVPQCIGNEHPNVMPYQTFRTKDGNMIIATGNDGQYQRLCVAAGVPDAATDPRFTTNALRIANREACTAILAAAFLNKTTCEWIEILEKVNVPCGPINRLNEVYADPQIQHRGLRIEVPHPRAGKVPLTANPIKFSRTPITYDRAPPLVGEHADEVLQGILGMSAAQVAALRNRKIV
jgi:crotonobetainyl-CoA:carnitine CoA-transferase CaiB-like acyl-CoA transferase